MINQKSLWSYCLNCVKNKQLKEEFCALECIKDHIKNNPYASIFCKHPIRNTNGSIKGFSNSCDCVAIDRKIRSELFRNKDPKRLVDSPTKSVSNEVNLIDESSQYSEEILLEGSNELFDNIELIIDNTSSNDLNKESKSDLNSNHSNRFKKADKKKSKPKKLSKRQFTIKKCVDMLWEKILKPMLRCKYKAFVSPSFNTDKGAKPHPILNGYVPYTWMDIEDKKSVKRVLKKFYNEISPNNKYFAVVDRGKDTEDQKGRPHGHGIVEAFDCDEFGDCYITKTDNKNKTSECYLHEREFTENVWKKGFVNVKKVKSAKDNFEIYLRSKLEKCKTLKELKNTIILPKKENSLFLKECRLIKRKIDSSNKKSFYEADEIPKAIINNVEKKIEKSKKDGVRYWSNPKLNNKQRVLRKQIKTLNNIDLEIDLKLRSENFKKIDVDFFIKKEAERKKWLDKVQKTKNEIDILNRYGEWADSSTH